MTAYNGTLFSLRWSAMEYRCCQPPCTRFIARDDPRSKCIKCLGFSHAREVVYGISKCKFWENLRLITLRSRLEVCEKESSIFPRRAPEASAASREFATWGSDVELEEMESEQTGLAFSLPPSPECVHDYLFPSPRARDTVSFGLDDILQTAASDSEDFGPALADALPPSGQEGSLQRPTLSSWTCFRVPLRSSRWIGLTSPASLGLQNSTSGSLATQIPSLNGGSCRFSVICIRISPDPGNSRFPPALLTRQPLTSPTLWVLWSRVTPPCVTLWPPTFHPLWRLPGSPASSFRPSHVGPLPPLSGSPTSRPVRQAWPSTRWPSFKPTRRTCLKRWTRGLAWLQRLWKSCAEPLTWLSEPLSTPHAPWGALWRVQWPQNAICGVEGEGVLAGLTHLTVWVIWGGG